MIPRLGSASYIALMPLFPYQQSDRREMRKMNSRAGHLTCLLSGSLRWQTADLPGRWNDPNPHLIELWRLWSESAEQTGAVTSLSQHSTAAAVSLSLPQSGFLCFWRELMRGFSVSLDTRRPQCLINSDAYPPSSEPPQIRCGGLLPPVLTSTQ